MTLNIIIIAYILGGIITMACIRAWDLTTGSHSEYTNIITGGLLWPAVWICFTLFGVMWGAYKALKWLIEWLAKCIYNIIMKLKNKHN